MGATTLGGRAPALDRQAFLDRALAADWRRCGGRPGEASVTFETTSAEVAAIEAPRLAAADGLLSSCLREAVWDLVLPAQFDEPWNSWTVQL
jgi:hypothetical protein